MGQKGRLDALTSLRWFAAFAVLLRHVGQTNAFPAFVTRHGLNQGVIGVSFFFVLSGFVLTWSRSDNDTSAAFYQRRFARLYPAYAVACADHQTRALLSHELSSPFIFWTDCAT